MEKKMTKFNEASYRTPCGEAGYIVRFDNGSAALIVAYHGLHDGVYGEDVTCEECPNRDRCELMDYEFDNVDIVCGWDEADALLELWEYEPTTNEQELDEIMKII